MGRTKAEAGSNERTDIEAIIRHINEKTVFGETLCIEWNKVFSSEIIQARQPMKKGNRKTHYDFEIQVKENGIERWVQVEHKGCSMKKPIKDSQRPWDAGVQFYNGGGNKFALGHLYAKVWYDIFIASGDMKTNWNVTADIPSYETWVKDAFRQGDPKTAFVQELKKHVKTASMNLRYKRNIFNQAFLRKLRENPNVVRETIAVINDILQKVLKEKEAWLTVHGSAITGDAHIKWYKPFQVKGVKFVRCRNPNTTNDLEFIWKAIGIDVKSEETFDFDFTSIIRWGKGCGFTNIRMDLR